MDMESFSKAIKENYWIVLILITGIFFFGFSCLLIVDARGVLGLTLLYILSIILIVPVTIAIVLFLIWIFKKPFPDKNSFITLVKIIVIPLVLIILILIYSSLNEPVGVNDMPKNACFNIYVVDDVLTKEEVSKYISESNEIWNKYNISIVVNNISFVESNKINLTKDESIYIFTKGTKEEDCENYSKILDKIPGNKSTGLFIIFMNKPIEVTYVGRGSLCGYNFYLISRDTLGNLITMDFTGWVTAHEIGHALNAGGDIKGIDRLKQNLMNDEYKILSKIPYISSIMPNNFLSQSQIDDVVKFLNTS